jgi:hypothetical protein
MAFDLEQLFQISLEYRLCLNHRIEGFLHSGRQIISSMFCHFNSSFAIASLLRAARD